VPEPTPAVLPHVVVRAGQKAYPTGENQEDEMMNWNDMGSGMGFGMGFGWLFGLLILALVVLAIAALIKYLRK
jgi:hypothetical protein